MTEQFPRPIDITPSTQDQWWVPSQGVFEENDLEQTIPRAELLRMREQGHLGAVAAQSEIPTYIDYEAETSAPETTPMSREEILFEPFEPQDAGRGYSDTDFDAWFGSDEDYQRELNKPKVVADPEDLNKAEAMRRRGAVTEESLRAAEVNFRGLISDPVIKGAFDEYRQANPSVYKERDLMQALREDATLRLRVGSRLLEAANSYPYQISSEDQKKSIHPGYSHISKLNPKEYAALLALAMSDGTYKDPGQAMGLQHSRLMDIENGRHRQAAKHILEGKRQWDEWVKR